MQEKEEKGKEKKKKKKREEELATKGHMEGHNLPNTQGTWMVKIEPPYP